MRSRNKPTIGRGEYLTPDGAFNQGKADRVAGINLAPANYNEAQLNRWFDGWSLQDSILRKEKILSATTMV